MARLHVEKMRVLIERIVAGDVPPGAMLPKEVDLARELDISRGTARECLRALEERGLVTVRHGRGAVVTDPDRWNVLDPDVMGPLLARRRGRRLRDELRESRTLLGADAAALAAANATPELAAELGAALQDGPEAFDRAVARASGNRPLALMLGRLLDHAAAAGGTDGDADRAAVLAAIAAGDPAAARASAGQRGG
jgi:GntR family transcriptional repressor for pyruvate dehydrogenase complex